MFGKHVSQKAAQVFREWSVVSQVHVHAAQRMCSSVVAAASSGAVGAYLTPLTKASAGLRLGSAVTLLGGGAAVALASSEESSLGDPSSPQSEQHPAVQQLLEKECVAEVLSPGQMLRRHPVAKVFVDQDHLFEAMAGSGQIHSFRCFYDRATREFHSVVQLGRDVCGFPQTVHGGLTAAIMDETFGGLGVCAWREGALGFRPPAYTARLEVDYKRKIPAGSVIVCSTQVEKVEDRKIWMTAQVTDGQGVVYAKARALFVAPRMRGMLLGWVPGFQGK